MPTTICNVGSCGDYNCEKYVIVRIKIGQIEKAKDEGAPRGGGGAERLCGKRASSEAPQKI